MPLILGQLVQYLSRNVGVVGNREAARYAGFSASFGADWCQVYAKPSLLGGDFPRFSVVTA
jgi:hypothetical protein